MADHWISGAIKHPGALHRELGVPEGEKIPAKKLARAEHSKSPTERKEAQLAETLKGMRHARKDGGRAKKGMNVNIIIAEKPSAGAPMPAGGPPMPPPPAAGPGGPGGPGFARQPMQSPPPGMPPMALPVAMPGGGGGAPGPMPRKDGGRTIDMDAGAGGGEGRLEKARKYGKRSHDGEKA